MKQRAEELWNKEQKSYETKSRRVMRQKPEELWNKEQKSYEKSDPDGWGRLLELLVAKVRHVFRYLIISMTTGT